MVSGEVAYRPGMERRRFLLTVLAGAAAGPWVADAQPARKTYHVGIVSAATTPGQLTVLWRAFLEAMRELGYVEGQNLVLRQAFASGRRDALPRLVDDLVKEPVDVIVTTSTPETMAAKQATSSIPIVMTVALDPVGQGLVASLARPGQNITGLTSLVSGIGEKYVQLLKELLPSTPRFAVLTGPDGPQSETRQELQTAARQAEVSLFFGQASSPEEIGAVLARAKREGCGGVVVPLDGRTYLYRRALAQLTLQYRLPAISWSRDYVDEGGLMAYGASLADLGRRAATIVDKILKGARPADLPIEQPTRFELVINLKAAKAFGLTIPPSLRLRADQLIE
jgi:putative ABC transport system substrate-binding protein